MEQITRFTGELNGYDMEQRRGIMVIVIMICLDRSGYKYHGMKDREGWDYGDKDGAEMRDNSESTLERSIIGSTFRGVMLWRMDNLLWIKPPRAHDMFYRCFVQPAVTLSVIAYSTAFSQVTDFVRHIFVAIFDELHRMSSTHTMSTLAVIEKYHREEIQGTKDRVNRHLKERTKWTIACVKAVIMATLTTITIDPTALFTQIDHYGKNTREAMHQCIGGLKGYSQEERKSKQPSKAQIKKRIRNQWDQQAWKLYGKHFFHPIIVKVSSVKSN